MDVLAVLYAGGVLRLDSKNPDWEKRDYFILSKGHAAAALYSALAQAGFIRKEELAGYYTDGGKMPGHPSRGCVPGVEASTGSLGHGLSLGCGMALAASLEGRKNRAFVLLSDGEMDEGSVWEAVLFAGAKKLSNLVAIVDYNKLQSFGTTREVLDLEPLEAKFKSFGWEAVRADGNSAKALLELFGSEFMESGKPKAVIADTTKGKGVSFMEGKLEWHYKSPSADECKQAAGEIEGKMGK